MWLRNAWYTWHDTQCILVHTVLQETELILQLFPSLEKDNVVDSKFCFIDMCLQARKKAEMERKIKQAAEEKLRAEAAQLAQDQAASQAKAHAA